MARLIKAAQPATPAANPSFVGGIIQKRKGNITQAAKRTYEGNQSMPEYVIQSAGETAGGVGELFAPLMGQIAKYGGKAYSAMTPDIIEKPQRAAAKFVIEKAVSPAAGKYGEFEKTSPRAAANINSIANLLTMLPIGKLTQGVTKVAGKAATGAGKSVLRSEMKIKDALAGQVERTTEEGVSKIIDTIEKHNLGSMTGGFKKIAKNTRKQISEAGNVANKILVDAGKDINTPKVDIDGTLAQLMDDLQNGRVQGIPLGEEARAANIVGEISKGLELRGYKGAVTVDKANEAKKAITEGRKLFKKGTAKMMEDPLAAKVNEIAYLKFMDEINRIVPEVKKYNQKIHDLIPVEKAVLDAAKRKGNWNTITMSDLFALTTGAGGYGLESPKMIAGAAGYMAGRRVFGGGRGASMLMKAGRQMQGNGKQYSLDDLLTTFKKEQ